MWEREPCEACLVENRPVMDSDGRRGTHLGSGEVLGGREISRKAEGIRRRGTGPELPREWSGRAGLDVSSWGLGGLALPPSENFCASRETLSAKSLDVV